MKELVEFIDGRHAELSKAIREKKQLDDQTKGAIDKALLEFREVFRPEA
jgi:F-type H+/Na+-transporting ATPase subunit alpha